MVDYKLILYHSKTLGIKTRALNGKCRYLYISPEKGCAGIHRQLEAALGICIESASRSFWPKGVSQ